MMSPFFVCKYWKTVVANERRSAFLSGCHSSISFFISFFRCSSGSFSKARSCSSSSAMMDSLSGGGFRHVSSASPSGRRPPTARMRAIWPRLGSPSISSAEYSAAASTASSNAAAARSARRGAAAPGSLAFALACSNASSTLSPPLSRHLGSPCASSSSPATSTALATDKRPPAARSQRSCRGVRPPLSQVLASAGDLKLGRP
mmetsp:Transcript_40215/g.108645  ORF Transcript_40215/g.108645 Transcript_40215/m.108645 type:complete len:203 (-) Transcript_40215:898-1506(-)